MRQLRKTEKRKYLAIKNLEKPAFCRTFTISELNNRVDRHDEKSCYYILI